MNWTTPQEIRAHLERYWSSGRLLAAPLRGESLFPLPLPLRRPDSRALSDRFDEVRQWIRKLEAGAAGPRGFGYQIEWIELNHRILGRNRIPARVTVPTERDALRLIDRLRDADRFRALTDATLARFPELRNWLARKPLAALDAADDWDRILAVLAWFRGHPRCGLYLRQLDIPRVDTKFIEGRRGLLGELLDEVLPPEAIDTGAAGARAFERRYGLRSKPALIRFRLLDPALYLHGLSDLTVPAEEFASLCLPVERVFLTENEVNGLAFPYLPASLVIFGLGYGVDRLAEAVWLCRTALHYWGDIDTHGFAILDRLRAALPGAASFLMDRETLLHHRHLWVREPERCLHDLPRLTPSEQALYDDLRFDRLGPAARLEQERIPFGWLTQALESLASRRM
ncbi:MAG: DUF3322 domain-containing protein [Bryobacteraceae bacterium]